MEWDEKKIELRTLYTYMLTQEWTMHNMVLPTFVTAMLKINATSVLQKSGFEKNALTETRNGGS